MKLILRLRLILILGLRSRLILRLKLRLILRLRGKTEDDAWWKEVGAIAPKVKEQMILEVKEVMDDYQQ